MVGVTVLGVRVDVATCVNKLALRHCLQLPRSPRSYGRTEGRTDGQTDRARSTRLLILIKNI